MNTETGAIVVWKRNRRWKRKWIWRRSREHGVFVLSLHRPEIDTLFVMASHQYPNLNNKLKKKGPSHEHAYICGTSTKTPHGIISVFRQMISLIISRINIMHWNELTFSTRVSYGLKWWRKWRLLVQVEWYYQSIPHKLGSDCIISKYRHMILWPLILLYPLSWPVSSSSHL